MNLIKLGKLAQDTALIFIFLTLLWLLAGCTGGQMINAVTPTATATLPPPTATSTSLPQPTITPTATESATATATIIPTVEIASEAQDFYYKGLTYSAAGLFEEALASFDQAITLQPNYALAYLERGRLYMQQKQLAEAKSNFHYALELTTDPEIKAEVKALLQQVVALEKPIPTPVVEQATSTPQVTPILIAGSDQEAPLNQPFTLSPGQTARLKEVDLALTFLSVLEDSRCPKRIECFWSGQVRIMIQIHQGQAEPEQFELNTNPSLKQDSVTYAGYTIQLTGIDPYPETPDQTIPLEVYQATFLVRPNLDEPEPNRN